MEMSCCKSFANQREQAGGTACMILPYCCTCLWLEHFCSELFDALRIRRSSPVVLSLAWVDPPICLQLPAQPWETKLSIYDIVMIVASCHATRAQASISSLVIIFYFPSFHHTHILYYNQGLMAAIPRMLSVAREEVTVLTTELATAARTTATEGLAAEARTASEAMNPVAVRQAVEIGVKKSNEGKHTCVL